MRRYVKDKHLTMRLPMGLYEDLQRAARLETRRLDRRVSVAEVLRDGGAARARAILKRHRRLP